MLYPSTRIKKKIKMLKTQRVDRLTGTLRVAANAIQLAGHRARRKNRRTLLREAEADIAHAKDGTEILDCLYVMETGMRYFFMRAQAARNVKGNEAVVRANMLEAVNIAERIAPYRHHRLAAIKVDAKDLVPRDEQKSLEQLRAQMLKHWERLAPVLDLEALIAPTNGSANRDAPEGAAGHD